MYEKLAWNNFLKTGDLESFLEYKRIAEMNNNIEQYKDYEINKIYNNIMKDEFDMQKNVGDITGEFNKDKGNSDKRELI